MYNRPYISETATAYHENLYNTGEGIEFPIIIIISFLNAYFFCSKYLHDLVTITYS